MDKTKPPLLTPQDVTDTKDTFKQSMIDRAGLGSGVDAAHFCNYLCTLYHIKAVGVQVVLHGQASGTDSHEGCKYPSCQHSSGVGVSVPV